MNITSTDCSTLLSTYKLSTASTAKTSESGNSSSGSYLDELKSKFKDLNFTAGNYSGGTTGSGVQGNVLISPQLLEKAANDTATAAKLEEDLSGIPEAEEWLQNQCAANGMHLDACGTIIDEDGNMSGWAQTTTTSEGVDNTDDEESDEKKLEEKKAEEKRAEEKEETERLYNSQFTEYDGLFETELSTTDVPYSLEVYA